MIKKELKGVTQECMFCKGKAVYAYSYTSEHVDIDVYECPECGEHQNETEWRLF